MQLSCMIAAKELVLPRLRIRVLGTLVWACAPPSCVAAAQAGLQQPLAQPGRNVLANDDPFQGDVGKQPCHTDCLKLQLTPAAREDVHHLDQTMLHSSKRPSYKNYCRIVEQNELDEVIHLSRQPNYGSERKTTSEAAVRSLPAAQDPRLHVRRPFVFMLRKTIYSIRVRLAFVLHDCSNYM